MVFFSYRLLFLLLAKLGLDERKNTGYKNNFLALMTLFSMTIKKKLSAELSKYRPSCQVQSH
jgi:hypothetical protein